MTQKPTYEELEQRVLRLEKKLSNLKLTEKALQKIEDDMSGILDATTETILLIDRQGMVVTANQTACKRLETKRKDLIGHCIYDFFSPEVTEKRRRKYEEVFNTGKFVSFEDNRESMLFEQNAYPVFGDGNRVERLAIFARDITSRKHVKESLLESEERLRSIFRVAPTGIGLVIERVLKDANERLCEMIGYSREEIVNHSARILYPTVEDYEYVRREKYLQISDHGTGTLETSWKCKDGRIIDVLLSSTPLDLGDLSKGVIFTALDITDRKRSETALKKSEKQFQDLFNSINDLIYTQDLQGRFISLNPAIENALGYSHDELIGHKSSDFMKPDFVPDFESEYLERLKKHGYYEGITVYFKKNSEKIYIEHRSTMVHPDDGEPYISGMGRDVTERVLSGRKVAKLQEQLTQAQKMEAIGTLAGGIAHDFNNILFPMFGYLEMMIEDVPKDNPLHGHLLEVFTGAKRARDLVKQILAFSRQSDHERKPLETQRLIEEALKLIKSTLPSTIAISHNIQKDCGLVFADPTHIHQIVMNLCTNAYHAMEKSGGKLTITLKEVELSAEDLKDPAMNPGPHVCLMVADNGPGMVQGIIDRIFDPYFTTKKRR